MPEKSTDQNQKEAIATLLKDMKLSAIKIRALIVGMPAEELLGYIYAQFSMMSVAGDNVNLDNRDDGTEIYAISEIQFLLEYVHAVLASDVPPANVEFVEADCVELFKLSCELQTQSMLYAIASTTISEHEEFGPNTAEIEFHAKSSWVSIRGSRNQVLEGEFYNYVLAPHDQALRDVYGVGASDIAEGFQDLSDSTRMGHANAAQEMMEQFEAAQQFAENRQLPLENVMEEWISENPAIPAIAEKAMDDLLRGGIVNVSRHTNLPTELLSDLAYQRGEEIDFYALGDFAGTPYRTLPSRKKPLIQLGSDYYAIDTCFMRDSGYRALLYNLLQRKPEYKKSFENRQKEMSELAFPDILADQLPGATVYQEVYYKDPITRQWCENDTVVLIDDVLFLVEAKAGAAATIASPAVDFKRHAQSVQDLVLKAFEQCKRFFEYLKSADEVPLFSRANDKYEEVGSVRRSDYRVMVPIGLTVESFSPYSSFCKELPLVKQLLGKHNFLSMSIDDLFILKRILPTAGEFVHYMEVRQAMAGIKRGYLFDEIDHLGAYISKNRFDQDIISQLDSSENNLVVWSGMSSVIDRYFEGENWGANPLPTQGYPQEVLNLLSALDTTRAPAWLAAESLIRNYGEQPREALAKLLADLAKTINQHPARYFAFLGDGQPLFVWLQNAEYAIEWGRVKDTARAAALSRKISQFSCVLVQIATDGNYENAQSFEVNSPAKLTEENSHIYDSAFSMSKRNVEVRPERSAAISQSTKEKKTGRNAPCPCGSGIKFKKCHGVRE